MVGDVRGQEIGRPLARADGGGRTHDVNHHLSVRVALKNERRGQESITFLLPGSTKKGLGLGGLPATTDTRRP